MAKGRKEKGCSLSTGIKLGFGLDVFNLALSRSVQVSDLKANTTNYTTVTGRLTEKRGQSHRSRSPSRRSLDMVAKRKLNVCTFYDYSNKLMRREGIK